MVPYLSGEFIAELLARKSNAALDLRRDSGSAMDNTLPALRSQSVVSEKPVPATFQCRKACLLLCSRVLAMVAKLVGR